MVLLIIAFSGDAEHVHDVLCRIASISTIKTHARCAETMRTSLGNKQKMLQNADVANCCSQLRPGLSLIVANKFMSIDKSIQGTLDNQISTFIYSIPKRREPKILFV